MTMRLSLSALVCLLSLAVSLPFEEKSQQSVANGGITNIRFSDDQSFLAALIHDEGKFQIYDGHKMTLLQEITLEDTTRTPNAVAFHHENKYVAIGDQLGNIYLYGRNAEKFEEDNPITSNTTSTYGVTDMAFDNANAQVIYTLADGAVNFFDVPSAWEEGYGGSEYEFLRINAPTASPFDFGVKVNSLAVGSSSGNLLIGGGENGAQKLTLYDSEGGLLRDFTVTSIVHGVAFSQDESLIFSAGADAVVTAYHTSNFSVFQTLTPPGTVAVLYEVVVSNDGLYVAAAGNNNAYTFQRASTDDTFTTDTATIPSGLENIAFGHASNELITVSDDGATEKGLLQQYSTCRVGTYYNGNACPACDDKCSSCYNSETECYACTDGNYLDATQCLQCMPGCLLCDSVSNCNSCDTTNNWEQIGSECECVVRFFESGRECQACGDGCLRCSDANTCTTCDAAAEFELQDDNSCACREGFRSDGANACAACGLGCKHCDATECSECYANQHFVPDPTPAADCICDDAGQWELNATTNRCRCKGGFFESDNGTCDSCENRCSLCTSFTNCTTCKLTNMTNPDGICECPATQFYDLDSNDCLNCDATFQFCIECERANQCAKCDDTLNRVLNGDETSCVCMKTFFEDAGACTSCGQDGCDECSSTTNCTQCREEDNWREDGEGGCECKTRYTEITGVCEHCTDRGCLVCNPDQASCIECDTERNWEIDGTDCKCIAATYDGGDNECKVCENGCSACTSDTACQSCYTDGHYVLEAENCHCEPKFYTFNKTDCLACVSPCLTCKSETNCIECIEGYSLNDNEECISEGLSPLIIVLIVVGGLAVLGAAAFAIIKFCRKKRSPLEEEGEYETLDNQT